MKRIILGNILFISIIYCMDMDDVLKNIEECTQLMTASDSGDYKQLKQLLKTNKIQNINITTSNGLTALMLAALKGHPDILGLLLENGANPSLRTPNGETALYLLEKQKKKIKACKKILESFSKPEDFMDFFSPIPCDLKLKILEEVVIELVISLNNSPKEFFKKIADLYSTNKDFAQFLKKGREYKNLIFYDLNLIKKNYKESLNKNSLAQITLETEVFRTAQIILESNIITLADDLKNLLIVSTQKNFINGVILLLKKMEKKDIDINSAISNNSQTPLMIASKNGYIKIAKLLIEAKSNCNNMGNPYGRTPLMLASGNGHPDIVKILLENGANVNIENGSGMTALMYASQNGNIEIIKMLLIAGANKQKTNIKGKSALIMAQEKGHPDIINLLS